MAMTRTKSLDLVCDDCGFERSIADDHTAPWKRLIAEARALGWAIGLKTNTVKCRRCRGGGARA